VSEQTILLAEHLKIVKSLDTEIKTLRGEVSARDETISYMNNKDRMARDNAELLRRVDRLKQRFSETFGYLETAIKLSLDVSTEDLSLVKLPEPLPRLLTTRYLG
jgi:hypothetical protein